MTALVPHEPVVIKRDLLWEVVLEVCGIEGPITASARGAYNRAVKDLRQVGATPEDVRLRAGRYRTMFPRASLTPTALSKWWPMLARERHGSLVEPKGLRGLREYRVLKGRP